METIPHHKSRNTWYDRYPDIFQWCSEYFRGRSIRILSFGCSTGEEVITLRDMYFTDSKIHGVDIDQRVMTDWHRLINENVEFSGEISGVYDLVFCLSVLCRAGDNWDNKYFVDFDRQLVYIDDHIKVGGLLSVYNSAFRLSDSSIYGHYEATCEFKDSGSITKYDTLGNVVTEPYRHVVFRKK